MTTPPTPPPGGPYPPGPPPPAFYPPQPPKSFWSSPGGILTIIGIVFAGLLVVCGGLTVIGKVGDDAALSKIKVELTSCKAGAITATAGYTVTNQGDTARRVTLDIEYRDASGARLDTDTAYVGEVPAGDTVRGEESTVLNAEPEGALTCKIVKVS
ncbi:FxLYD domain-containing protein [Micromonospora haikouensis]|uniref:FxLYD domain-containing protein n=1 Tax=Micromonospora haikouensis TaxID=686309 RepID=UPI003D742C1F